MSKILEIACFNLESARKAEKAGADRVELCKDYLSGGRTPSDKIIKAAISELKIPVHVMIRPRGGSFDYTSDELKEIKKSIRFCKEQNVKGIVFGCLTSRQEINVTVCKEILEFAKPMHITFHRAIDECSDIKTSMELLIDLGFDRVLTSGGKSNAFEGRNIIKTLQDKLGHQIKIIVGGGIRSSNLKEIIIATHCSEFHSSAITNHSEICDPNEIQKLLSCLRFGGGK